MVDIEFANNKRLKVILIEDNLGDTRLIREMLETIDKGEIEGLSYDFIQSECLSKGMELILQGEIDVVLLDLFLPDSRGLDTFLKLRNSTVNIPIVILTSLDDESLGWQAIRDGAQDYLIKEHINSRLLKRSIRYAVERQKLQASIVRASKLEAIRLLAGGIAHDFNNILMGIVGNISLVKMDLNEDSKIQVVLSDAEMAAMHGAGLTQKLLAFFKDAPNSVKRKISLGEMLIETASFTLRGSNVTHNCIIEEGLWPVEVDETQIGQVIHNLIMNATQAMPKGGVITVRASNVTTSDENDAYVLSLPEGPYIRITIKDQGCGILPKHLDKIFDPYFTTKQDGHGFGLATAYFIMKHHGGDIRVESEIGKGTIFYLYLPAIPQIPGNDIYARKCEDKALIGGTGKILVMDDEEMIRGVVGRMLEHLGYKAEFSSDGAGAITSYKEAMKIGKNFDAVILDRTVPGCMGGKEAAIELMKIDPEAKVILSSGYSNDLTSDDLGNSLLRGYLAKPYRIGELDRVLSKVISCANAKQNGTTYVFPRALGS